MNAEKVLWKRGGGFNPIPAPPPSPSAGRFHGRVVLLGREFGTCRRHRKRAASGGQRRWQDKSGGPKTWPGSRGCESPRRRQRQRHSRLHSRRRWRSGCCGSQWRWLAALVATQLVSAAVADADMPRRAGMAQVRGRTRVRRRGTCGGSPAAGQLCRVGRFMLEEKKNISCGGTVSLMEGFRHGSSPALDFWEGGGVSV